MSVLQVYLSWANSVLSDVGSSPCPGVGAIQEGRVLCQLIDQLCPEASLLDKVQKSCQKSEPQTYLRSALEHMRQHGIKFHFSPQDILDGDIKSILDVLWLIILNYGVHSISSSPYQRSVGIGKKLLLDWCQQELNVQLDPQNTLTYNLCTGDWFLKLLAKNTNKPINEALDREPNLQIQLATTEDLYGIKRDLVSPADITEATIDEHTLMIYVSLLRLKIGDTVDIPLEEPTSISFSVKSDTSEPGRPTTIIPEPPSIVLSSVDEDATPNQDDNNIEPEVDEHIAASPGSIASSSGQSSTTQSPPRKVSPEVTDPDTSDWNSQSSGSPISSFHDKHYDRTKSLPEADSLLRDTITKHVEEHMDLTNGDAPKSPGSRIPVRVKEGEGTGANKGMERRDSSEENKVSRTITVRVQRPRSPNSIMAEARLRQEQDKERKKREKMEIDKMRKEAERDEHVMTGSASEGGNDMAECLARDIDIDPIKSDEDDRETKRIIGAASAQMSSVNGEDHKDGSMFSLTGQNHDMELLLEALRHARTEANTHDKLIQNVPADQPDFRQVVDKNIQQLEAQLEAVKAQSKELFEDGEQSRQKSESGRRSPTAARGRALERDRYNSRRGECRSPPRGILDVMANNNIDVEETSPKERAGTVDSMSSRVTFEKNKGSPHGILRYPRSPSYGDAREGSRSPEKYRSTSPYQGTSTGGSIDEQDSDKRLIKFLTNEIENLKLKMAVMEQKNNRRAQSPSGQFGPKISGGLPERDRSPGQISSRARARFPEYSADGSLGYSPVRRGRTSDLIEEHRSRSPRYDRSSPLRSSRSPSHSPISMYRSRTPERLTGERTRATSPSPRVLSLQDLSTSVVDDLDGNTTFSPASGARPVSLGYSSPIRKVTQDIWGYGQTEDEYYADTAKYESWKSLISRDACTDEDMLELKQALASALVELDILQARLKNATDDIKRKMDKTTEVLNDCRAHLTKSQAENAELRAQNEREKAAAAEQEVRIKDMEENLHSSRSNLDDKRLELEESVITLKGIVNLDKTQITQLTEENEKLRKKISDFQRENIKLKEDFNELKMYNDKAQTTIKDLRTCLDDARNERKQLISEIKKLQTGAQTKSISSIINHYMEKGLYEEAEKDHMNQRARSRSNTPVADRVRERSVSPVPFRSGSPVRHSASNTTPSISNYHTPIYSPVPRIPTPTSSPYRPSTPVMSYTPLSRSQTPNHLEDEVREIYPHRRTRSYIEKYGTNEDEDNKAVDFSDPELLELLKPQPKFDDELDADVGKEEKPRLMFSPYMDKDYMPKYKQGEIPGSDKLSKPKPTNNYRPPLQRKISMDEFENKKFVQALDHAVKETPAQLAQQQFLRDLDLVGTEEVPQTRWRNPAKGILKTAKSAQNMSIKESTSPSRRSVESRSYSPSVRNSQGPFISRSYTPDTKGNYSSPLSKYSPSTMQPRSQSPGIRNSSPGSLTARSHSPGSRSYSPERQWNGTRDSGYSTPTTSTRLRGTAATDVNHRLSQTSKSQQQKDSSPNKGSLLTDQERRYADLLIDKYTRQHLIGLPLASSCS